MVDLHPTGSVAISGKHEYDGDSLALRLCYVFEVKHLFLVSHHFLQILFLVERAMNREAAKQKGIARVDGGRWRKPSPMTNALSWRL